MLHQTPMPTLHQNSPKNSPQKSNDPVVRLIFELAKLPGIGERTATRLAYFILRQNESDSRALSDAIIKAKQNIVLCQNCMTFTDSALCSICSNSSRNYKQLCVVEHPSDITAIEQTGAYRGFYHVLHGVLSPLDDIGPDELKIHRLIERLSASTITPTAEQQEHCDSDNKNNQGRQDHITELILATNPSVEGEATALYLTKLIRPLGLRLTKLAHGLPVGGLLEYTDRQTIGKAFENRMEMR